MIRQLFDSWTAKRLIRREYPDVRGKSIAAGFIWGREGVGGLRNHIEAIKKYSRFPVSLFPEIELAHWSLQQSRKPLVRTMLDSIPLTEFGIVHSHVDPEFIQSCLAASEAGVPWIHTFHTLYFPEDWGGSLAPWQTEINECLINTASKADVLISISPWLQQLLVERYGIQTQVIPNGYNAELCEPSRLPARLPEAWAAHDYILYVGSLFDVKNPGLFVELAEQTPDRKFVMIGKDLVPEKLSAKLGRSAPSNVVLAGPQNHLKTLRCIHDANALVMTSHSEGLPTVVMEAMSLGTPVIAPNSFGCGDLIQHEQNGLSYEPGDRDALVNLVSRSPDPALGKQAAQDALQHYAWPSIAKKLDALYAGLLNA